MFRLAIAEAERTPEIAQALESIARESSRASLRQILNEDVARSLLAGDVGEMTGTFMALLFGNLQLSWLLRVERSAQAARDRTPSEVRNEGALQALPALTTRCVIPSLSVVIPSLSRDRPNRRLRNQQQLPGRSTAFKRTMRVRGLRERQLTIDGQP